jgi:hypothetical protein
MIRPDGFIALYCLNAASLAQTSMHDQNLEAAERLFEAARPAPVISEYQREQLAVRVNLERLAAERLAREAGRNRWRAGARLSAPRLEGWAAPLVVDLSARRIC